MSIRKFSENDPDYEVVKFSGNTIIGKLYAVKRKSDGKELACSEIKVAKADGADVFQREALVMRTLEGCRYIVLWGDLSFDPERLVVHLHIDVSFKPEMSLDDFIKASTSSIRKETVAVIMNTLAKALVDCHQKGVYHQDIRPRNILLAKKEFNGFTLTVAYLTNFGCRAIWEAIVPPNESSRETALAEMPCFMAPEFLDPSNPTFTAKSDVFALGCTMYELCCRTRAYKNKDRVNVPQMPAAQQGFYGNSMSPMPGSLMQLEADQRPDIQTFSATMQAYCESRFAKFKTRQAWVGAGVQLVGAAVAVQNPALANVIQAATQATVDRVMAPGQAPAQAQIQAQVPAQAQVQAQAPAPTPLQTSELAPVLVRGLPQPEPPASVPTLPQTQATAQPYPQAFGQSYGIGLQEIIEALLEIRCRAKRQSQPGAQVHPQASELSSEDLALAQEILLILLEKCSHARAQTQSSVPVYPQAPGLEPGWSQSLSQTLPEAPGPIQQQIQTGIQNHPQTSGLLPSHQKAPPVAIQSQPQIHQPKAADQPQTAAKTPTPAQQAAFQLALQRQQSQWQNFGGMMQAQNNATNQTMSAMYANNMQTMQNTNSMYRNQAQQQFAQFQQTQGINDANRHLRAQAFGQAVQGNNVLVIPAGQQSPYFYGGV